MKVGLTLERLLSNNLQLWEFQMNGIESLKMDCAHCSGTGTCTVDDGGSCGSCLQESDLKIPAKIVHCDVCLGVGKVETKTERIAKRTPFLIVMVVLAVFYLYVAYYIDDPRYFDKIFPVVSSLTTMIVAFYFARK